MFKKQIAKRQKINKLKKDCFEARQHLIGIQYQGYDEPISCIRMKYSLVSYVQDPWIAGVDPEKSYRMAGPSISYCFSFNSKKPMEHLCRCTSCPMYRDYINYISTLEALQAEKTKTR